MSGQRYHPQDQRYAPSDDSRFPPRDRSPPPPSRYAGDRFSSSSSYRPGYQGRPEDSRDSSVSSLNREAPRGPKATFDAPRGAAPFPPAAPRGRGFSGRGEYRGSARAGDAPRDSRDPASWGDDRDRSWRDRDLDRRDRRPSSPGRPRQPDFRDFREPSAPPPPVVSRDGPDFSRRGNLSVQPAAGASGFDSRRDSLSSRGRGFASRPRGRGDWDARGRERETFGFGDERPLRSRSRSPGRDYRPDRDIPRARENLDLRDDRRFDAPDRPGEKVDRDRNFERYPRDRSPFRNESRRPSVSSTAPSSPRPLSPAPGQTTAAGRPFNDPARVASGLRRASNHNLANERWDERRENLSAEAHDSRERNDSRPSSPPPAIQVPAFGWNVWKAPTEPKAMKQNAPVTNAPPPPPPPPPSQNPPANAPAPNVVPPNAPTGPKLVPPTGPKVDRVADDQVVSERRLGGRMEARDQTSHPPRTPAHVHPQRLNRLQGQAGATSPPASPTFIAPSGPRASSMSTSPQSLGANIPTGPKIDRAQQQTPSWAPMAPAAGISRQWQRPGGLGPPGKSGAMVPTKRDFSGEERKREFPDTSIQPGGRSNGFQNGLGVSLSGDRNHDVKLPMSPTWGEEFDPLHAGAMTFGANDRLGQNGRVAANVADHDEGEDIMELDEDDFEKKERRFQQEKARLESELVDLSSPHLTGSHTLLQLARLSCISLWGLPSRANRLPPPLTNEQALFGTGQLLTPKAEGLSQNGVAVRRHFVETEPAPITSLEIESLPFLNKGLPTPLEELDVYKQNLSRYREAGPDLEKALSERFAAKQEREHGREDRYGDLYRPWMSHVEQVDKESKAETPMEEEPEPSPSVPAVETPAIAASTTEGRRRGGVSEYDIERVLQESLETANRENARRMKQELSAKIDHDKEAIEKNLKDFDVREQHDFVDKTRQISVEDAITRFNFEPPPDILTATDHTLLVKYFRDYPKKWGKIAQSIRDEGGSALTYKDCISHYYATKWNNQEYKEKRDKRRQRGQKGNRIRGGQGRPKANALISNLGDVRTELYDGDDFGAGNVAVTDSGRPRRAAAPTFGEKETEEQLAQQTSSSGRRGPKGSDPPNSNNERPTARRSRGSTKERGGRKSRGQPSMRQRSATPEKMDSDSAGRTFVEASVPNGNPKSEFESGDVLGTLGSASGLAPRPSNMSRGVVGEIPASTQPAGLQLDGAAGSHSVQQQSRSGPSSYWSVQEVSSFPDYLAHYGTDWHSIAQKMDTKTGTMVKNYYFRLISNNSRPDLEERVRKADQKKQRGEQPIEPPAISAKKRGDVGHISAPRPLAPNSEMTDSKDGSPHYRTSNPVQQIMAEPRSQRSYSPVSQPPSVQGLSKPNVEIGVKSGDQMFMQARQSDQPSRQPQIPSHQGPPNPSSRPMSEYESQGRTGPPSLQHLQGRHYPDGSMPMGQQPLTSTSSRYYQNSPQQHYAQMSMDLSGPRASQSDMKSVEEKRQYPRPMDPPTSRPLFSSQPGQTNMQRMSSPPRYGDIRRSQPASPVVEQSRLFTTPSQASIQAPPAPPAAKSEIGKRSSVLSLLNPDDGPRRSNSAMNSQPIHQRTATPPQSQYPPRPSSHPDRGVDYAEAERGMGFSRPPYSQQTSASSRLYSEPNPRESQTPVKSMGRQDWQGQSSYAPLTGPGQPSHRGQLSERAPPSQAMEYPRPSLQALQTRHVPSPPPSLGFSHPSQHVQQQSHQAPTYPSHSQPPSSSSQTSGRGPSLMGQNQQAYGRNNNLGMPPQQQQGLSQRPPLFESLSGRGESDYRPRQDPLSRLKDPQLLRERDSQTRSNLRPDDFLIHGSGNYRQGSASFKQPAQQRQPEHERGHQYGPVQDEQRRPLSPRLSQAYPGRTQEQPPPGSG